MTNILDNTIIEFNCTSCGSKISERITWFQNKPSCPFCNLIINIEQTNEILGIATKGIADGTRAFRQAADELSK